MKELDLLKKDWQKNNNFRPITEFEIYKMVHKKSSSIVKLILIVSVLELLVLRGIDFFNLIFDNEGIAILKEIGLYNFEKWLTALNIIILLIFIFTVYKSYKKIATDLSTKQLMENILQTRKVVQYYVNYNLIMLVATFLITIYKFVFNSAQMTFFKFSILNNHYKLIISIVILLLFTLLIFTVFWLIYKLLYGILLKKLYQNYNELKKIE